MRKQAKYLPTKFLILLKIFFKIQAKHIGKLLLQQTIPFYNTMQLTTTCTSNSTTTKRTKRTNFNSFLFKFKEIT